MKPRFWILLAFLSVSPVAPSGCDAYAFGKKEPSPDYSKLCVRIDEETGFTRCETNELICYVSRGGQQCWPKAAPAPQARPSAAPAAAAEVEAPKKVTRKHHR